MKKLIVIGIMVLLMAGTVYAQGLNLSTASFVDVSDSGVIKASPGVLYGISGIVTGATSQLNIFDGAQGDTDEIIWTGGAAVDKDGFSAENVHGIEANDTGIWYNMESGSASFTVQYK